MLRENSRRDLQPEGTAANAASLRRRNKRQRSRAAVGPLKDGSRDTVDNNGMAKQMNSPFKAVFKRKAQSVVSELEARPQQNKLRTV